MANYNVICPIRHPLKCNLSSVEKEQLEGPGKYTAFFMYQFKDNDPYLKDSVSRYFKSPLANLLDASELPGTGVKLCKICKLILASDFGVAALTPINPNVFMEVGMFLGFGKPVLYLVNPGKCMPKNLPFDLSHEIVIEHTSDEQLRKGLEQEAALFMEKVRLQSEFEREFEASVEEKLQKLTDREREILTYLLLENRRVQEPIIFKTYKVHRGSPEIEDLCLHYGFLEESTDQYFSADGQAHTRYWYQVHPSYRQILEELVFEEQADISRK